MKPENQMTDTEIVNALESLIECGSVRIMFNEDDDDLEDDWGKIPIGYSIRVRACNEYDVSAPSLRECVQLAKIKDDEWINDTIGKLENDELLN
jgi:hypothetical protein